ncbi:hypothetical protein [Nocardia sp. NPDC005998]|uniref:hypothetical protein n=1 Tax=Nocardia sp. NPDC005998 TaxID=3156894 RepID=UPI0033BA0A2C
MGDDGIPGVPIHRTRLPARLEQDRRVQMPEPDALQLGSGRLGQRVVAGVRDRLRGLSGSAREVVTVAASLGRYFELDDLAGVLGLPASRLISPVEELLQADVLGEIDGRIGFGQGLVLDVVRSSVPRSMRRALDLQAARALLSRGSLSVEVAMQLADGAEFSDNAAIRTLLDSCEVLGSVDPSAASVLGRRTLDLAPSRHPLRGALVAETVAGLHGSGRVEEALAFADAALRRALPPEQEATIQLSVAGLYSSCSELRCDRSRKALALDGIPRHLRTRHRALLAHNLVDAGRVAEARALSEEATVDQRNHPDDPTQRLLELTGSSLAYLDGRFESALELADSVVTSIGHERQDARVHVAQQWRCVVLDAVGRGAEAEELIAEYVSDAQRDRQTAAVRLYESTRGRQLLQRGRLEEAAVVLDAHFSSYAGHELASATEAAAVVAGEVRDLQLVPCRVVGVGREGRARLATGLVHASVVEQHGGQIRAIGTAALSSAEGGQRGSLIAGFDGHSCPAERVFTCLGCPNDAVELDLGGDEGDAPPTVQAAVRVECGLDDVVVRWLRCAGHDRPFRFTRHRGIR